ncbi:superfamily II DNA/RNA helicase SNF2 family [Candidatus Termititenax aidoneus]|uniref:Superfamily II DNA/RNA helicase SNF2 family n=1 Tax=Termititenax aidoneus TaxID=2218524 RepID=A0A388T996_TERA1|nr:superfamily II DNA/RNA helicase SNF2 family [Candidatus Termititenax aidoneus]
MFRKIMTGGNSGQDMKIKKQLTFDEHLAKLDTVLLKLNPQFSDINALVAAVKKGNTIKRPNSHLMDEEEKKAASWIDRSKNCYTNIVSPKEQKELSNAKDVENLTNERIKILTERGVISLVSDFDKHLAELDAVLLKLNPQFKNINALIAAVKKGNIIKRSSSYKSTDKEKKAAVWIERLKGGYTSIVSPKEQKELNNDKAAIEKLTNERIKTLTDRGISLENSQLDFNEHLAELDNVLLKLNPQFKNINDLIAAVKKGYTIKRPNSHLIDEEEKKAATWIHNLKGSYTSIVSPKEQKELSNDKAAIEKLTNERIKTLTDRGISLENSQLDFNEHLAELDNVLLKLNPQFKNINALIAAVKKGDIIKRPNNNSTNKEEKKVASLVSCLKKGDTSIVSPEEKKELSNAKDVENLTNERIKILADRGIDLTDGRRFAETTISIDIHKSDKINWFEFTPSYFINGEVFTHQELQGLLNSGQKHIYLRDGSLARIPEAEMDYLQKYLQNPTRKDSYKIKEENLLPLVLTAHKNIKINFDADSKKIIQNITNDFKDIEKVPPPRGIQARLSPYQLAGYHWLQFLAKYALGGILADDMGLGKTLQTIVHLARLKEDGKIGRGQPALILAPANALHNWADELKKFAPGVFQTLIMTGSPDERKLKIQDIARYDLVLTSYGTLVSDHQHHYSDITFGIVIADEAQNINKDKNLATRALKSVNSRRRLALTGTPILNYHSELWSIFDWAQPGFLYNSLAEFKEAYAEDSAADRELLRQKTAPLILRRTKEQTLNLPFKTSVETNIPKLSRAEEAIYLHIRDAYQTGNKNHLETLNTLRYLCSHPYMLRDSVLQGQNIPASTKFNYSKKLLKELLANTPDKIVFFAQFSSIFPLLEDFLKTQKVKFLTITGATKSQQRQELVRQFNNEPDIRIMLGGLKACNAGINLQSANRVIIYDPWWNTGIENQAIDRLHRRGQEKEVFVYRLYIKGSVEERMLELQQRKNQSINGIIASDSDIAKSLTKKDIEFLLGDLDH